MKSPETFGITQEDLDIILRKRWVEFLEASKMQFIDQEAAEMAAVIFTNGYYMACQDFNEIGIRLNELKNIIQEL